MKLLHQVLKFLLLNYLEQDQKKKKNIYIYIYKYINSNKEK